jgi:Arc/MetJ family transcription regulator
LKATDLLKAITTSPEKDIVQEAMRQFVEALEREKRESQREAKKEREKEDRLLEMAKALVRAIDGLNGKENASRQTILANLAGPFPNIEQAIRTAQEGERREEAEEANAAARQELTFRQQTQRNQNLDAFK